jgi:hypothetical protein
MPYPGRLHKLCYIALLLGTTALLAACGQPRSTPPTTIASNWQDAPLLAQDNEWGAFDHQQAVDAQGHTLAVWEQFDGARYNIWANRKAPGQGWGVAQLIEADNAGSAYNPQIAVDSQGNAVAVWQQSDGQRARIAANRYVVGTGWSKATWIDAPDSRETHAPQVSFDNQGHAVAVWQQKDGQRTRIYANRLATSTGWGQAAAIEHGKGYASAPHIARDAQGQVVAVWQLQSLKGTTIHANRYLAGAGWGSAELVGAASADADYPPTVLNTAFK